MAENEEADFRPLLGTSRAREALDALDRWEQLGFHEVRDIISTGVASSKERSLLLDALDEAERQSIGMPHMIRGLERRLRSGIFESFQHVEKSGGITAIAAMVFDRNNSVPPWSVYNPDVLIRNFSEGSFGRISGVPRTGKTNLACLIMEEWEKAGNVAISNIRPDLEDDRYRYVTDARGLFRELSTIGGPSGWKRRWLFVLDEGGLIWAKQDVSTRRAKDLEKLIRIIGKLRGNMILIDQRADAIPTTFQQFASSLFFCHKPGLATLDLRGPNLVLKMKVKDLARTSIPYDSRDIAFFTINQDIPEMLEAMAGSPDPAGMIGIMLHESENREDDRPRKRAPKTGARLSKDTSPVEA